MRLSDYEASFLYAETPATPMHRVCIAVIDGVVDADEVTALLSARLHMQPKLRQCLGFVPFNLAHPVWTDASSFDLSEHIHSIRLNKRRIDRVIEEVAAACGTLLDRSRPLWRLLVARGVPKRTVVVSIMHQSMVGTGSPLDILNTLFDLSPNTAEAQQPPAWQPQSIGNAMQLASDAILENTQTFSRKARQLASFSEQNGELIQRATESVTRFLTEPVYSAPWNERLVGSSRSIVSCQLPSGELRKIRNAFGGSINDIVNAICLEGAARYLAHHNHDVGDSHLRIMCPVTIRREDEHGVRGNRASAIFPVFDAHTMSATERLKHVRWETESIKHNREAQALQLLTELAPPLPPAPQINTQSSFFRTPVLNFANFNPIEWLGQFNPGPLTDGMRGPFARLSNMAGFNFALATVPGSQATQFLCGHPVADIFTIPVLAANLGLGISVTNYIQSTNLTFASDPEQLPDLDRLVGFAHEVAAELLDQATAQSSNDPSSGSPEAVINA